MKVLLLAAGKPLFALLTGAAFVSMPVAQQRAIEVEQMHLEHMHELEALERAAAGDRAAEDGAAEEAPEEDGAKPEEAPVR